MTFAVFGQVTIDPNRSFYYFGQATDILLSLGKTLVREKLCKPSSFDKKFKNQA